MLLKYLILAFSFSTGLLLAPVSMLAQTVFQKVYHSDSIPSLYPQNYLQTQDGGIMLYTPLTKLDGMGNASWSKRFLYGGLITELSDGNFIVTGMEFGSGKIHLIKVNTLGDTLWTNCLGGTVTGFPQEIVQTSDGGFALIGVSGSQTAPNDEDVFLLRADSLGNLLWTKSYGDSDEDRGRRVLELEDGGFILLARSKSYGLGPMAVLVIRTDSNGNIVWSNSYSSSAYDFGRDMVRTLEGNVLIIGETTSFGGSNWDIFSLEIDTSGNIISSKTYSTNTNDWSNSVEHANNGGYIVAGSSLGSGNGNRDMVMMKLDSNLFTEWAMAYGGDQTENGYAAFYSTNGSYNILGNSNSFSQLPIYYNTYHVQTDSLGNSGSCFQSDLVITESNVVFTGQVAVAFTVIGGMQGCTFSFDSYDFDFSGEDVGDLFYTHFVTNASCPSSSDGSIDVNIVDCHPPIEVLWSNGDTTQSLQNLMPGTYILTLTDSLNNTLTDTFIVGTLNPVTTQFSQITICEGDSALIYGAYHDTAGTYSDTLTASTNCDSINYTTLIIASLPSATFSGLDSTYCLFDDPSVDTLIGSPSGGTFGGTGVVGEFFDPLSAGVGTFSIYYVYTDSNGCSDSTWQEITVDWCPGILQHQGAYDVKIYPNPNTGKFMIEVSILHGGTLELHVLNSLGQEIFTTKAFHKGGIYSHSLDLSEYGSGFYMVRLVTEKGTIQRQVVIE